MSGIDLTRPGVWTELFPQALKLMAHLESQTRQPLWTFGGGTVNSLAIVRTVLTHQGLQLLGLDQAAQGM